jgi:hypothetical protein
MLTIPRAARQSPCRPLTPRQRSQVRQALASAIGDGRAATRDQVAAELFGGPTEPVTPDPTPDAPVTTPDTEVSIPVAAARLGLAEKTVRRYLAPSSGKLARLGGGVSHASVERFEASR